MAPGVKHVPPKCEGMSSGRRSHVKPSMLVHMVSALIG